MVHINNFHRAYIDALRLDGHEVYVMARGEGADFDIPFEKKMLSGQNGRCRRMIREILARENFDAVILNTTLAAFHIRLAMKKKDRPRVINIVHGYLFPRGSGGVKKRILLFCERLLRKKTDAILVMNDEDLKIANENKLTCGKVELILGMGASCPRERVSREAVRKELGAEDSFAMCYVGELSKRKNQRLLIEALADVKREIPNAMLWLVGDGDERGALEDYSAALGVADSVAFTGKRDNPCDFIRAADLYVSASNIEGLPFNIIEALGVGAAVVGSDIKGQRDLLSSGAGVLFKCGDRAELKEKILAVYNGDISPSAEKKKEVYELYSFENAFPKTYALIKGALSE